MEEDGRLVQFQEFVEGARWQFAKTMAKTPHEYTLRKWNDAAAFDLAVETILELGYDRRWRTSVFRSLDLGERYFWPLPGYDGELLINRALKADD